MMEASELEFILKNDRDWIDLFSIKVFSGKSCYAKYYKSRKEQIVEISYYVFAVICLAFSAIWLYCWSVLINDFADIDEFIFETFEVWFQWYFIILAYSAILSAYMFLVVFTGLIQIIYWRPLHLCLFHKIVLVFCFASLIAQFCLFDIVWTGGEQWSSVASSFDMTSPFLQLFALVIWVLFSIYACVCVNKLHNGYLKYALVFFYLFVFLFLLILPFCIYSPCIGKDLNDLKKPFIIGHRGDPSAAPENTLLSYQKAIQSSVYALETDVRISSDGVPFLMHDETLFRTTNVAELFPKRKHDRAESFNWTELSRLNAGKWYLNRNPFLNRRFFNSSYKKYIAEQKILAFHDFVSLAAENNKSIIFDIFCPPYGHLNYSNYLFGALGILVRSDLPQSHVIWPLSNLSYWQIYKHLAPGFRLMTYDVVQNATAYEIDIFNLPYSRTTENTIFQNVSVIEYVVDRSWTFSRAWCQGAWAVTTNYCSYFYRIAEPSWLMSKYVYFTVWSIIDVLSIVTVIFTSYFCRKKIQVQHIQEISRVFDNDPLLY